MRIIAGTLKGRRLATPEDSRIRPTSDRVKEAIFSMVAPYLDEAVVVDLFSGTGNLGLEAVSRGAKLAYFGDKSRRSLSLTQKNIEHCGVSDRAVTLFGDWEQVICQIPGPVDIIFLDPPYQANLVTDCIRQISTFSLLAEGGIIVTEHGGPFTLPVTVNDFVKMKEKKYGTVIVTIYSKHTEDQ